MLWFNLAFWVLAIAFSVFYGLKAVAIFVKEPPERKKHWEWWWHQTWLNFFGSLAGWCALWFLIQKAVAVSPSNYIRYIDIWDLVMFVLAFIGITGYLPYTVVGLIQGINVLAVKAVDLVKKWLSESIKKS